MAPTVGIGRGDHAPEGYGQVALGRFRTAVSGAVLEQAREESNAKWHIGIVVAVPTHRTAGLPIGSPMGWVVAKRFQEDVPRIRLAGGDTRGGALTPSCQDADTPENDVR